MTLFLIVISITNIVLGYALAIYFGHGKLPWQIAMTDFSQNHFKTSHPVAGLEVTESVEPETETDLPATEDNPSDSSVFDALEEQPNEQTKTESVKTTETNTDEEIAEKPAKTNELGTEVEESKSQTSKTETPQEGQSSDPETATKDSIQSSDVANSTEEDSNEESIDETFLEGITAFQNQLNDSPHEDDESGSTSAKGESDKDENADTAEVEGTDTLEDDADEVLAGIESFRAQLEDIQGNAESSTEDSASADVESTEKAETTS